MSQQTELIKPEALFKESILIKAAGLLPDKIYYNLSRCGEEEIVRTCKECGAWETFFYKCSLKYCPQCNWMIARTRAKMLSVWTTTIKQPKHIVLTRRNSTGVLTRKLFRHTMRSFAKIRRTKIFDQMNGGCVSMELTNEGKGWHVHLHVMADVRWVDASALAVEWGKLMGQDFAIVKVKDCRGEDYLHEVTKYACKPSQLASWTGEEINQFIRACTGIKFFSTFGTLFKMRGEIRQFIKDTKPETKPCSCGACSFKYQTEEQMLCEDAQRKKKRNPRA